MKTCRRPVGHKGKLSVQLGTGQQALVLVDRFHLAALISNAPQGTQPTYPPAILQL